MPFEPGQSGNPAGRPPGLPDKRTKLRALLEPHSEELVSKAVSMALAGDTTALRMCLDRLVPPFKALDPAVVIDGLRGALANQGEAVLTAIGEGRLTPDQGATLLQALSSQARLVETTELERRIAALEARNGSK